MSKMEPYCDFKASIDFYRLLQTKASIDFSDIRKIYEGQSFYKDKGKWWGKYQVNDLAVFNDIKGPDYQLPQRLKFLDCFPYVIESRGIYEIYQPLDPFSRKCDILGTKNDRKIENLWFLIFFKKHYTKNN